MIKSKGFTLLELLVVIVIIAVVTSIAIPSVLNITERSKARLYCSKLEIVQKSAERYADDRVLSDTCEINDTEYGCEIITAQSLINDSYIIADDINGVLLDPRDKTSMNTLPIIVYNKDNRNYAYIADEDCASVLADVLTPTELSSIKHTLTTVLVGGSWSGISPTTLKEGATLFINNPTKVGFIFAGWTPTGAGSSIDGTTFTMGTADATLTANWTVNSYTLTVLANGGTWSGTTPQTIINGGSVIITNPTRSGYTFTGWTPTGAGSSIDGTTFTMGTADATLTANWQALHTCSQAATPVYTCSVGTLSKQRCIIGSASVTVSSYVISAWGSYFYCSSLSSGITKCQSAATNLSCSGVPGSTLWSYYSTTRQSDTPMCRCKYYTSCATVYTCSSGTSDGAGNCYVAATLSSYTCSVGALSGQTCYLYNQTSCPSGWTLVN